MLMVVAAVEAWLWGREQKEAGGAAETHNPLQILYLLNIFVMLTLHGMTVETCDIKM